MICVSIGRSRHRHMIAEHRHLAEQGAQLVELRLDYIRGEIQLTRLLAERPCPAIVTCRRVEDGGQWSGSEDARQRLLRMAVAEGADYVDLEEDVADEIPRFGATKRIISLHDFRSTPDDLDEIHARLASHDADIVKIAVMANRPHDNLRVLSLSRNSKIPTIAICMGEMGIPSRVLAGKFGAPFTYATFHHERALAPGQLSYREMVDNYHYEQINPETKVFAVVADPIRHSLSPAIHNAALHHDEIDAVYLPFRVPSEHLKEFVDDCPQLGIEGLSVTIPHKEAILDFCTGADRAVTDIGAANTIIWKEGKVVAYNTDCRAALDSLLDNVYIGVQGEEMLGRAKALVLGAGGAARAVVYALCRRGADVVIASRTHKRAQALAADFDCRSVDWSARHGVDCDLVVNCTPVGMHPNLGDTPFDKHHLKPSMAVFDTVYNPENTLLIKEAMSQSCQTVAGTAMFVCQAALQYSMFTGREAPLEVMYEALKRSISAAKTN